MRMLIVDQYDARRIADSLHVVDSVKRITVDNPTFIPRVGETVMWFYEPSPHVQLVIYDYPNGLVWVVVG